MSPPAMSRTASSVRLLSVRVRVLLALLALVHAQQEPPHSFSWYSGDIAAEVDRANGLNTTMPLVCIDFVFESFCSILGFILIYFAHLLSIYRKKSLT
jgi:hypothetical protein